MYSIVLFIVWTFTAILSLSLNITCLVVLRKCKELEDVPRAFLTSMSAADLGICIFFVLPAIGISVVGHWPFEDVTCVVQVIMVQPCYFGAVFSLLAVNIDRYISIEYPLKYHNICNVKRARIAIILHYLTCYSLIIFVGFVAKWKANLVIDHHICFFRVLLPWFNIFWALIALTPMTVCILVVTVIYIRLLYISRRRNDRIANLGGAAPKRDTKSDTTFFYVGLSMVIGYFPYFLVSFLQILHVIPDPGNLIVFTRVCFASNGWWNVLIYYKRNKRLRMTFNKLVQRTLKKESEMSISI